MNAKGPWITLSFVACFFTIHFDSMVLGQPQSFQVRPNDTQVIQGTTAILYCQVASIQGQLQWVKDGFGLGFDRAIVGMARYSVTGSVNRGENNLMIRNAELSDDAEYQCQVGPVGGDISTALVADAYLSVLVPPKSPVLNVAGATNTSLVEVAWNEPSVNVTCTAQDGKPAAKLTWLRNGQKLTDESVQYKTESNADKTVSAISVLSIRPRKEYNKALYTCQASHPALSAVVLATMELSVKFPPRAPEISGYKTGTVVQTGDVVTLTCRAEGGNPRAKVEWYKNGVKVDSSYTTDNTQTRNDYQFTVASTDNNAIYRCEAWNDVTPKRLTSSVKLTVQFGPEKVVILGPEYAKAGETITLQCRTSNSNPRASVTWNRNGQQLQADMIYEEDTIKGGWMTISNITVTLIGNQDTAIYTCFARNPEVQSASPQAQKVVSVLYPPGKPTISGFNAAVPIRRDTVHTMTCTSVGGNPLATLSWWKGDKELTGDNIKCTPIANQAQCQLKMIAKQDDNKAIYSCKANNSATTKPLVTSVTLSVNFPPKTVKVESSPKTGKVGQKLTLTCTSASSNPAADITWSRADRPVTGVEVGRVSAENGGWSTVNRLVLFPKAADDGANYFCHALNKEFAQAESNGFVISVKYPPEFIGVKPIQEVTQGQSLVLTMATKANPAITKYEWYKNGAKLKLGGSKDGITITNFVATGSTLNMKNITRKDDGIYMAKASNAEGSGNVTFDLNVKYPATIRSISPTQLVDPQGTAILRCQADANPMTAKMITWSSTIAGYKIAAPKTSEKYENGVSTLTVYNVQKEKDTGEFICTANNKLGKAVSQKVALLVKFAAKLERKMLKAASAQGVSARLNCIGGGAPKVEFSWFKGDKAVNTSLPKYSTETKDVDLAKYQSSLYVHNVTKEDYGEYRCIGKNDLGTDSIVIDFDGQSKPDSPFDIKIVNTTHNSITIKWQLGFDGGLKVMYQVRYRSSGGKGYKYADAEKTVYTVTGLALGTQYELTVRAKNKQGYSEYQSKTVSATTLQVAPSDVTEESKGDEMPLIIILVVCIVGLILLVCNALLIVLFIRRRRRKAEKDGSETVSQANTLEMYAPSDRPLYPGNKDSESYSTYDKSMDDYTDSYRSFDDEEDVKRIFLPPQGDPYHHGNHGGPHQIYAIPPVDAQRSFPVNQAPPVYNDNFRGGSLPRKTVEGENFDNTYADKLRHNTLQKSLTGLNERSRPSSPSRSLAKTPPPAPPARYSSQGSKPIPPLPARNYGSQDVPTYAHPPGTDYRPSRSDYPQDRSHPPSISSNYSKSNNVPSEMRGHLV
nr:nephrin [Terebratalia transversa]